jgi:uncharacterized membrane protein
MAYFAKNRVEAVCDGIFAIVLTLLILEIKVPHLENGHSWPMLLEALKGLLPKFIAWVISFFTVMVMWVNHHRIFESIKKLDQRFFWLNANLMLWISFYPFPTALMGDYPNNSLAVSFYGMASLLMGLGYTFLRFHMWRHPEITEGLSARERWLGLRNVILFGPLLYVIAAAAAWIHTYIAFAVYAVVILYFMLARTTGKLKVGEP